MASISEPRTIFQVGEFVNSNGRTCYIEEIQNVLGFNRYILVDIDSGVTLNKAAFEIEKTELKVVTVPEDMEMEMPDIPEIPKKNETTENTAKERFPKVSTKELDNIELNRTSENTKKQTSWAIMIFKGKTHE